MFEQKFAITNLNCPACVTLSREALIELPGVTDFTLDNRTGEGSIISSRQLEWSEIQAALAAVGKDVVKL